MKFLLENPAVFNALQNLLGVSKVRKYFIEQYVKPVENEKIMDIGCGTGGLAPYFHGCDYCGFDSDLNYINQAKKENYTNAVFFHGDLLKVDLPKNTYDVVIAAGVIHHLNDLQADSIMALASSILKPGGRFLSFDMCRIEKQSILPKLMNWLDRGRFIRAEAQYKKFASNYFSDVTSYDYCESPVIPVNHCVLLCKKK